MLECIFGEDEWLESTSWSSSWSSSMRSSGDPGADPLTGEVWGLPKAAKALLYKAKEAAEVWYSASCVFKWALKLQLRANFFWQMSHEKGLSPKKDREKKLKEEISWKLWNYNTYLSEVTNDSSN